MKSITQYHGDPPLTKKEIWTPKKSLKFLSVCRFTPRDMFDKSSKNTYIQQIQLTRNHMTKVTSIINPICHRLGIVTEVVSMVVVVVEIQGVVVAIVAIVVAVWAVEVAIVDVDVVLAILVSIVVVVVAIVALVVALVVVVVAIVVVVVALVAVVVSIFQNLVGD